MKPEMLKKIIDWFIDDIKESFKYSHIAFSEVRILEMAIEKTDSLIKNCLGGF
jgi:hypothetical protein